MNWKCPVCGKEFEHFGIKEFAMCPKTTLFGNFKIRDVDGEIKTINRKVNKPVCSEECKLKNEEQYFVEEYKGCKIYCVNGRYMPYIESDYWYDTIKGVRDKIDNPHLVPASPSLISGLMTTMSGEPGNI